VKKAFTSEQTWLSCISCGYRTGLLEERKFRCPKCGDLYQIEHNFSAQGKNLKEYTSLFDSRVSAESLTKKGARYTRRLALPEWIMPYMPEDLIVSLGEGNVPIVQAGRNLKE
jgi:predicted RNA-binding Zn-ribbon protein involved in translation (DUF1610 family)